MLKPVVCIGAALADELLHSSTTILLRTTNIVTAKKSAGGVCRNIAHQVSLLNIPVQLICVFGNDGDGDWLKEICTRAGVQLDAAITARVTTGKYTGIINSDGSLFTACLTNPSGQLITPGYLQQQQSLLSTASFLLLDTNLSAEAIEWLINFSNQANIPLVIEPVSVPPARKLSAIDLKGVYLITPNEDELPAICSTTATTTEAQIKELLQRGVQNIWLHKGASGSVFYNQKETLYLPAPEVVVIDCTGAGDGSVAGFIASKYAGKGNLDCLKTAHTLAAEILQVNGSIITHINQEQLIQLVSKYYN